MNPSHAGGISTFTHLHANKHICHKLHLPYVNSKSFQQCGIINVLVSFQHTASTKETHRIHTLPQQCVRLQNRRDVQGATQRREAGSIQGKSRRPQPHRLLPNTASDKEGTSSGYRLKLLGWDIEGVQKLRGTGWRMAVCCTKQCH